MSQSMTGDLDVILKKLMDDPNQFDSVKKTLKGRLERTVQTKAQSRYARVVDDDDDLFDNMPV